MLGLGGYFLTMCSICLFSLSGNSPTAFGPSQHIGAANLLEVENRDPEKCEENGDPPAGETSTDAPSVERMRAAGSKPDDCRPGKIKIFKLAEHGSTGPLQVKVGLFRVWLQLLGAMSKLYRVLAATPIADNSILRDRAVRPLLPMIFPRTVGATVT